MIVLGVLFAARVGLSLAACLTLAHHHYWWSLLCAELVIGINQFAPAIASIHTQAMQRLLRLDRHQFTHPLLNWNRPLAVLLFLGTSPNPGLGALAAGVLAVTSLLVIDAIVRLPRRKPPLLTIPRLYIAGVTLGMACALWQATISQNGWVGIPVFGVAAALLLAQNWAIQRRCERVSAQPANS